ncbi:reverse transcriptase domain-containing protein [Tanacetum coccineum]
MALLPPGFLKPLYPDIMDMINDQDIEHTISPTPPPSSLCDMLSKGSHGTKSLDAANLSISKGRKALLVSSVGLNELNRYSSVWKLRIPWFRFKKLLIKKYCPRTEAKKMEDEFYNMTVKGNDLKTYIRRFQELEILCPTMVSNSEKLMEVFIEELPRSIEGNVTASKPQTLEEAITIT